MGIEPISEGWEGLAGTDSPKNTNEHKANNPEPTEVCTKLNPLSRQMSCYSAKSRC